MADETTTTDTTATTTEATQSGDSTSGKRMYTEEQVTEIVQKRLARERQNSGAQKQQASAQQSTETKATSKAETGQAWTWDHEDELNALIKSEGVEVTPGFKKRMRSDFESKRPGDLTAWAKDWFADTGLKKATTTQPATTNDSQSKQGEQRQQVQTQTTANVSDKGSASGGVRDYDQISLERPLELTSVDIERMQAKHGFDKANQMIAERVGRQLNTVKLIPDRRR